VAHTPEKARPLASKLKLIYAPRLVSDHIMVKEDFERLHKFLLETVDLSEVSDDMRQLVEDDGRSWCITAAKGAYSALIRTAPTIAPRRHR
jgi:hypothetical protein